MGRRLNFHAVVCILLFAGLLPLQALAACKEKISELNQCIASPEVDPNMRNSMKMFRDQAASACEQGHEVIAI
jgi:hypothetical protein